MFHRQHTCRQRFFRITIQNRHHALRDDRAIVQLRRHKMNGAACHAAAFLNRPPMRVQTGKRRQQRRMNIDAPPFVMRAEFRR